MGVGRVASRFNSCAEASDKKGSSISSLLQHIGDKRKLINQSVLQNPLGLKKHTKIKPADVLLKHC